MTVKKVIIPAAGLGKRFYPLTRAQPKEMLPLLDKPVIHYVVEEAVNSGLDEVLIIVGKGKDAFINYFDKSNMDDGAEKDFGIDRFPNIYFVRQKEPLGLGDAIKYANSFVKDEPFVVLLGDTVYKSLTKETITQQLLKVYEERKAPVIAVEEVPKQMTKDYGIIKGEKIDERLWLVRDMMEKPKPEEAPSNLGITGAYVLEPDIFSYLSKIKPGANGEYQLTDALKMLSMDRKVLAYSINGKRYDIGKKETWIKVFVEFAHDAGYI